MKELSIEEKAQRYDEVVNEVKNLRDMLLEEGVINKDGVICDNFNRIFPELKESEDEKVRKEIVTYLKSVIANKGYRDIIIESWIAWLEKQGEHANFRNKIQIGDKVTRNKDGVIVNLSQLSRVAKKDEKQGEKQGEQNPDTDFSDLRTWKYIVDAVWTEKEGIGQYLDSPFTEEVAKKLQKRFGNIEQKPAEVRTTGYWHVEDVEQNPAWSEEDDIMVHDIDYALRCQIAYPISKLQSMSNWILNLKDRVQPQSQQEWSEEDKEFINDLIGIFDGQQYQAHSDEEIVKWLKSIRLPYNKEWDENDEEMLKSIIATCELACEDRNSSPARHLLQMQTDWLKSLRPQEQWKPSDEQMANK